MLADIVVTKAHEVDAQPAVLRTTRSWTKIGKKWFVDDSSLAQVARTAEAAAAAVERMLNATGLVYVLLGLERRPTKCHLAIIGPAAARITVWCKHWLGRW